MADAILSKLRQIKKYEQRKRRIGIRVNWIIWGGIGGGLVYLIMQGANR